MILRLEVVKLFICIREQIDIKAPFLFGGLKPPRLEATSVLFTSFENNIAQENDYALENIQNTITKVRPLIGPAACEQRRLAIREPGVRS